MHTCELVLAAKGKTPRQIERLRERRRQRLLRQLRWCGFELRRQQWAN